MADAALTGLHHVALTVRDLAASAEWYERLFDLEQVIDEPGEARQAKVYRIAGTSVMLGLVQHGANDGTVFRPDRTGLDHAAFHVATRDGIDAWTTRLDNEDVEHSGVISIPMGAILNFADPDGIQLAIFWESGN